MMSGNTTDTMIPNNRTVPNIKQEIENPTTPTQNYHQVCSPSTTIQHQEVKTFIISLENLIHELII